MIHDAQENRSKHLIKLFLKDTAEKFNLRTKMTNFHKRIIYTQLGYRKHVQALANRC